MRPPYIAAVAATLVAACFPAVRPIVPGPLDTEGEIYVEAQPLPPDARLAFRIESFAALRADGTETPLVLVRPSISAAELKNRRLIAWGRLEPGTYAGFRIKVSKATVTGESG